MALYQQYSMAGIIKGLNTKEVRCYAHVETSDVFTDTVFNVPNADLTIRPGRTYQMDIVTYGAGIVANSLEIGYEASVSIETRLSDAISDAIWTVGNNAGSGNYIITDENGIVSSYEVNAAEGLDPFDHAGIYTKSSVDIEPDATLTVDTTATGHGITERSSTSVPRLNTATYVDDNTLLGAPAIIAEGDVYTYSTSKLEARGNIAILSKGYVELLCDTELEGVRGVVARYILIDGERTVETRTELQALYATGTEWTDTESSLDGYINRKFTQSASYEGSFTGVHLEGNARLLKSDNTASEYRVYSESLMRMGNRTFDLLDCEVSIEGVVTTTDETNFIFESGDLLMSSDTEGIPVTLPYKPAEYWHATDVHGYPDSEKEPNDIGKICLRPTQKWLRDTQYLPAYEAIHIHDYEGKYTALYFGDSSKTSVKEVVLLSAVLTRQINSKGYKGLLLFGETTAEHIVPDYSDEEDKDTEKTDGGISDPKSELHYTTGEDMGFGTLTKNNAGWVREAGMHTEVVSKSKRDMRAELSYATSKCASESVKYRYKSSDKSIATIGSKNGKAKFKKRGVVTFYVEKKTAGGWVPMNEPEETFTVYVQKPETVKTLTLDASTGYVFSCYDLIGKTTYRPSKWKFKSKKLKIKGTGSAATISGKGTGILIADYDGSKNMYKIKIRVK